MWPLCADMDKIVNGIIAELHDHAREVAAGRT